MRNMNMKFGFLIILVMVDCVGCRSSEPPSKEWLAAENDQAQLLNQYTNGMAWPSVATSNETVMPPGMRVRATTADGKIEVEAGPGFKRSYTWNEATRSAILWARKKRWYGSFGLYYPGPGENWKSNNGITRGVLEEGVLWFDSEESALRYLKKTQPLKNCVYSHDGLVVAWQEIPARKQLNVDVWQIMIAGSKPKSLPFSSDDRLFREMP